MTPYDHWLKARDACYSACGWGSPCSEHVEAAISQDVEALARDLEVMACGKAPGRCTCGVHRTPVGTFGESEPTQEKGSSPRRRSRRKADGALPRAHSLAR